MRRLILTLLAAQLPWAFADKKEPCQVASPLMKMVKSCYAGDMSRMESQGLFMSSIDSTGNGVNYCYNTLAFSSRQGPQTKIDVIRDNDSGKLRVHTFRVEAKNILDGVQPTVVLKGLEAKCFAYQPENDHCSSGFLGLGRTDLPLAFSLKTGSDGYQIVGPTADRNLIKQAQAQAAEESGDVNIREAKQKLWTDIHARLMTKTRAILTTPPNPSKPETLAADYRECMRQYNEFVVTEKLKDPFSVSDLTDLAKVTTVLGIKKPAAPSSPATTGR